MAKGWQALARRESRNAEFDLWAQAKAFTFQGMSYPIMTLGQMGQTHEEIQSSFTGYINGAYKRNGVVFAVILSRLLLFTEARFLYQRFESGLPTKLYGSPDLSVLETPWPNASTGDLLARMEQDVSLAGNAYIARPGMGPRLRRLRPDWVDIVLSAPPELATESDVIGYIYYPGGKASGAEGTPYLVEEVAHWAPIPDPDHQYIGMSWLTPALTEIQSDTAYTTHKLKFIENGATPTVAVAIKDPMEEEDFKQIVADHRANHTGLHNAYKTWFIAGGADVHVIGADLKQLDFKSTQGAGETRICADGGVPPIIVGLSEGLQASTYSNYGMARRKFGDHWARPQWRTAASALGTITRVPPGSRLWYDDRAIAFLREDQKDAALITQTQANAIRTLNDAGYDPDVTPIAVATGNMDLLVGNHTGLFSVQLQPPITATPDDGTGDQPGDPSADQGDGNGE